MTSSSGEVNELSGVGWEAEQDHSHRKLRGPEPRSGSTEEAPWIDSVLRMVQS